MRATFSNRYRALSIRSVDVDLMLRRLVDTRNRIIMIKSFDYDRLLG